MTPTSSSTRLPSLSISDLYRRFVACYSLSTSSTVDHGAQQHHHHHHHHHHYHHQQQGTSDVLVPATDAATRVDVDNDAHQRQRWPCSHHPETTRYQTWCCLDNEIFTSCYLLRTQVIMFNVSLYCLEACPLLKCDLSSLDFVIVRFLMTLFNTNNTDIINNISMLNCLVFIGLIVLVGLRKS